jgi:hypothetical protein
MRAPYAVVLIGLGFLAASCGRESPTAAPVAPASPAVLPSGAAVLPETDGKAMLDQCSRGAPEAGEATWTPSAAEIIALETALPAALAHEPRAKNLKPLSAFARQYVGIVRHGRRFIYGNVFPGGGPSSDWKTMPVIVCDGGPNFFGAEYDVAAGRFTRLDFNGPF